MRCLALLPSMSSAPKRTRRGYSMALPNKLARLGSSATRCKSKKTIHTKTIIVTAEQRGCDLIVMASHGRSGIAAVVLGSVTTKVLTHTKIPVLVCH
jgi:Universal stress protein family